MLPLHLYARVPPASSTIAHETAGAARTRLSLRPLVIEGEATHANLGRIAPRDGGGVVWLTLTLLRRPCERRDP